MCIETQSLATALLPQFASEIGYDLQLMRLLSAYQLNPGTETYKAVKNYLSEKRSQQQQTLNTFNTGKRLDLNILDYENNLLWSTASLSKQDKIVLLYEASEYSQQATEGSAYQKFEDGSEYNLAWVSGGPLFTGGGAFKIGSGLTDALTVDASNATVSTYYDTTDDVSYNIYTFTESGIFSISSTGSSVRATLYYVLVGGGGTGGQAGDSFSSGGGGGGGDVLNGYFTYSTEISVTVSGGGSASTILYGDSSFNALSGADGDTTQGGEAGNYTAGGTSNLCLGGGGGGAVGTGYDGSDTDCDTITSPNGNGGSGLTVSQTGIPTATYGGGGGGSALSYTSGEITSGGSGGGGGGGNATTPNNGAPGAANTGGGGGGSLDYTYGNPGSGASGICILSILTSDLAT